MIKSGKDLSKKMLHIGMLQILSLIQVLVVLALILQLEGL